MARPKGTKNTKLDPVKHWLPEGLSFKELPAQFTKETKMVFIDSVHGEFVSTIRYLQDAGQSLHPKAKSIRKSENNPGQTPEAVAKRKETNLKKFGHISPLGNEEIKKKVENIFKEKYGVARPFQDRKFSVTSKKEYEVNNYLTEEKLGKILVDMFGESRVTPQYNWNNKRRADYKVVVNKDDAAVTKNNLKSPIEVVQLLIEFDGQYHYKSSTSVHNDLKFFKPLTYAEVSPGIYILRIPYWLQITSDMCFEWFGRLKDYSDKFPQGFISRQCPLPGVFCSDGEKRFIREYEALSDTNKQLVLQSLQKKIEGKGLHKVVSQSLAEELKLI